MNAFVALPPALVRGHRSAVVLDVYNSGNVFEPGITRIQLTGQPADGSAAPTVIATIPVKLNMKPDTNKRVTLKFLVSKTLSTEAGGLISTIDADGTVAEFNEDNNWVGPVIVTVV